MAGDGKNGKKSFYLHEEEISLKVVFDNLRNYAIIGGIVALAQWVNSGKFNIATALLPKFYFPQSKAVVWAFLLLAFVLLGANAAQSFLMLLRLFLGKVETGYEDDVPFVPRHQSLLERLWDYFCWVLIIGATLMLAWVILTFAMYLVLFAATGGR